jgi:hypothetical protein
MMPDKNIELEIDRVMQSLDNVSSAQPGPFFYARLRNRLENKHQTSWDKVARFITNPAFAVATIALVLSLDGFLLYNTAEQSVPVSDNSVSAQYLEFYDTNQDFYTLTYDDVASNNP